MQNITDHKILNMVLYCLLDEINGPTGSLKNTRDFLFQKNLLKSSMSCPGCNTAMSLVPCSSYVQMQTADLLAKRKLVCGPGSGFLDTARFTIQRWVNCCLTVQNYGDLCLTYKNCNCKIMSIKHPSPKA